LLVLTAALGISRVAAQVHSPHYIIASLIIDAVAVFVAVPIAKRVLRGKLEPS